MTWVGTLLPMIEWGFLSCWARFCAEKTTRLQAPAQVELARERRQAVREAIDASDQGHPSLC